MSFKPIDKSKIYIRKNKKSIMKFADAFFSAAALFLGLQIMAASEKDSRVQGWIGLLLFAVLALSRLFVAFAAGREEKVKMIENFVMVGMYFISAVVYVALDSSLLSLKITSVIYFSEIAANRVISMIKNKTVRSFIINGLAIFLLAIYFLAISAFGEDEYIIMALIISLFIAVQALVHIITNSFNQIKLGVLRKILRKTFAGEILFGLLMLVIAFSMVFVSWEPEVFKSYSDALWYCFAVVTTIGFGDFSAVTPVTRVISVILGLYGIIVVAVITSVIINFYNEVKDEKDPEDEISQKDGNKKADENDAQSEAAPTVEEEASKPSNGVAGDDEEKAEKG